MNSSFKILAFFLSIAGAAGALATPDCEQYLASDISTLQQMSFTLQLGGSNGIAVPMSFDLRGSKKFKVELPTEDLDSTVRLSKKVSLINRSEVLDKLQSDNPSKIEALSFFRSFEDDQTLPNRDPILLLTLSTDSQHPADDRKFGFSFSWMERKKDDPRRGKDLLAFRSRMGTKKRDLRNNKWKVREDSVVDQIPMLAEEAILEDGTKIRLQGPPTTFYADIDKNLSKWAAAAAASRSEGGSSGVLGCRQIKTENHSFYREVIEAQCLVYYSMLVHGGHSVRHEGVVDFKLGYQDSLGQFEVISEKIDGEVIID